MKTKVRTKHKFPLREYAIAVTTGCKTRYFYGRHLHDAIAAAGKALPDGKVFTYARFERKSTTVAELKRGGTVVASY